MPPYPSEVKDCTYGKCLAAMKDLKKGTVVEKFEGIVIKTDPNDPTPTPEEIPEDDIRYFIYVDHNSLIIPRSDARYANHSCDPNCTVNDRMEIVTIRSVKKGEELCFSYNDAESDHYAGYWDPRWDFKCCCGSPSCQGTVDSYAYRKGNRWIKTGKIWSEASKPSRTSPAVPLNSGR